MHTSHCHHSATAKNKGIDWMGVCSSGREQTLPTATRSSDESVAFKRSSSYRVEEMRPIRVKPGRGV